MAAASLIVALKRSSRLPDREKGGGDVAARSPPSRFGRNVEALAARHDGLSGFHLLADPRDAFAARVQLARHAERTLDLQYYIWTRDRSGTLLLKEIHAAAQRGVKVRLLLDDHGTAGLDGDLAGLASDPRIEVRLYNPFVWRHARLAGFLFNFARLNRRMHNKCFVADGAAAIIGGRNIGDDYFGASDGALLVDMDVIALGPIVDDIAASFDDYWHSPLALPIEQLVRLPPSPVLAMLHKRADAIARQPETIAYVDAIRRLELVAQLDQGTLPIAWASARLVTDDPRKAQGRAIKRDLLATRLRAVIGEPRRELRLVSAYFVPGKPLVAKFIALVKRGVEVSILTNGAGAADVGLVFAYYAKYRRPLVKGGVRLFELRRAEQFIARHRTTLRKTVKAIGKSSGAASSGASSLHAKTFTVDGERLFVGSFNVDPRSFTLNTELGVVIDSPVLARTVNELLDARLPDGAFEVCAASSGGLEWLDRSSGTPRVLTAEPGTTRATSTAIRMIERLPLEWLM